MLVPIWGYFVLELLFSCVLTLQANESQRVQFCKSKNQEINRLATRKSQRGTNPWQLFFKPQPSCVYFQPIYIPRGSGFGWKEMSTGPERAEQSHCAGRGRGSNTPGPGRCPGRLSWAPRRDSAALKSDGLHRVWSVLSTHKKCAFQICWIL